VGAGESFTKDLPAQSIRVGQYIEDTRQLVQYLKTHFKQSKYCLLVTPGEAGWACM
jgi:hypothetical protein